MPVDTEGRDFLKRLYGRLSDEPLTPDNDELYEPLYDNSAQEGPPKEDPVALMRDRIDLSAVESFQLFSGFRGTGKTTELLRLKLELEKIGYFVIYADAMEYINQAEPIDISSFLIALACAFTAQLQAKLKDKPDSSTILENFSAQLMKFLGMKVAVKEVGIKAVIDLKFELKSDSTFRQKLKDAFTTRPKDFKDQVNNFFANGVSLIHETEGARKSVVFIFDQLEQMRGTLES
jgi:hypothetical protein